MSDYEFILVDDPAPFVRRITLNRPEKRNALSKALERLLLHATRDAAIDPAVRVVINEAVCEGCGDCSSQSNCLSVEPLETELGRKRSINQSTCNKDQSCVKGFCPSFVTVEGGQLRKKNKTDRRDPAQLGELPDPELPSLTSGVYPGGYGIVVAGVGGTGVITIGQLLGMAAHIEGKGVVTQDAAGLAQDPASAALFLDAGRAPRASPRRVISAKPRVMSAARAFIPKPNPSAMPVAIASIFFTAPPTSTPITSSVEYTRMLPP